MSPRKKRMKISAKDHNILKRQSDTEGCSNKRAKSSNNQEEDLVSKRRKNFVTACEQVSYKAYFDHKARLLLIYLPSCLNDTVCKHHDSKNNEIKEILPHVEEAFMINIRTNMWSEALEVCILSITPTQYLSTNVLKQIVEIMMNAHDDKDAEYSISDLIFKCQQILMQNFSTHPPCMKKQLRLCYNNFLNSPMDLKEQTFTNRNEFGSDKGLVKYCMNRLEYEISSESKEESLVEKYENIPEDMKCGVKGLHWQKEKFEIYELLERTERINRLMAVLESLIELVQIDLAIWNCRYTHNLDHHMMRSHKPLMAYILWSNNVLYTGIVINNCKQILKIFTQMVHMQYPENHIRTMAIWVNAMIQTFYICEKNCNSDYPNVGIHCLTFANDFYKIISEMPRNSIVKILEMIKPTFMRNLIGSLHLKKLLSTEETCVIRILIEFIRQAKWNKFTEAGCEIQLSQELFPGHLKVNKVVQYLINKCNESLLDDTPVDPEVTIYPKMDMQEDKNEKPNLNHVVHTLYVTLDAYLDAFNVAKFQETLDNLNELLEQSDDSDVLINTSLPELKAYCVTEQFIKKYRSIYQILKELMLLLQELRSKSELPEIMNIFENIDCLEF